jgi:hypothetical protein
MSKSKGKSQSKPESRSRTKRVVVDGKPAAAKQLTTNHKQNHRIHSHQESKLRAIKFNTVRVWWCRNNVANRVKAGGTANFDKILL